MSSLQSLDYRYRIGTGYSHIMRFIVLCHWQTPVFEHVTPCARFVCGVYRLEPSTRLWELLDRGLRMFHSFYLMGLV
jgi:hypothetical protein